MTQNDPVLVLVGVFVAGLVIAGVVLSALYWRRRRKSRGFEVKHVLPLEDSTSTE